MEIFAFQNVSFRYKNYDEIVLKNINLNLEAGKTYGLIGVKAAQASLHWQI